MEQRFTTLRPRVDLPKFQAILAPSQQQADGAGKPRSWYRITNLSEAETEITLYDDIGICGITAGDFTNELRDIKSGTITLRINSMGGDVFDGWAIYNALKRHRATVNVFIDGLAGSIASVIAMAGETVKMMPHSQMAIHDASGGAIGPAEVMRQLADILDKQSDNIASVYAERAGGSVEEWRARMREETWFSDQEAVDLGLADSIEGEDAEEVAARLQARLEPEPDPEPEIEPEVEPIPLDFQKAFDAIADEADEAQYAVAQN